MPYLRHIIFYILFLQVFPIHAQENAAPSIRHYTDENGLPQNSVTKLAFDNAGFLWFTTNAGLVRFDGRNFKVWEKRQLRFNDDVIEYFVPDREKGLLYVISRNKELGSVCDGKFTRLPHNVSAQNYRLDAKATRYLYGHVLPYGFHGDYYSYIIPAGINTHYLLKKDTLTKYQDGEKKYNAKLSTDELEPWRFFVVADKLYHLNQHGVIRQYSQSVKKVNPKGDLAKNNRYGKSGYEIRSVVNSSNGDVFIYLENSLYILEEDSIGNLSSRLLLTGFDFSDHAISSILYDRHGDRVFAGSYTDGLFVLKNKQFKTLSVEEMFAGSSNSFTALVELEMNKILTSKGSVFAANGLDDYLDAFSKLSDGTSLAKDKSDNIYSKHISEIYQWNSRVQKINRHWSTNRIVSVMYSGFDDNLWIGTKTPGGLYRLKTNEANAMPERLIPSLPDVNYIMQAKADVVWIGTAKGLYVYNSEINKLVSIQELKGKNIRSLYAEGDDIWVTAEGYGVAYVKEGKAHLMPLDKESFLFDARCMLLDSLGYFWITTGKGLFRASKIDFVDYASKTTSNVYYSYYGKSNGFNTNEFSGFCEPCGISLANGYFAFPSLNGLVLFNPNQIKTEYPKEKIYIDRIDLDGKRIYPDSITYVLTSDFKRVAIYYTTPYFGSAYDLNFEMRLGDEEWQPITSNPIVFNALPSGRHEFSIRKIDGVGAENYTLRTIVFDVPPAYWQTWWFVVLCVLALLAIIYTYTRLRVIFIQKRNELLEESIGERTQELKETIIALKDSKEIISRDAELQKRLTASIAHDVKTPLKYLLLTAGSLSKIPASELGHEQETIKTVYKSIYRIYHFTDNLLAYIKSSFSDVDVHIRDAINLRMLVKEKVDIFNDISLSQSTVIQNDIDDDMLLISNKNLLSIVIHNIIDNAVKFTFNGVINIRARQINHEIEIVISDTGVGIHPEQMESIQAFFESEVLKWDPGYNKHNGLGLVIIKEIVKQLKGRILMDSEKGIGTTIVLYIPE